MCEVYFQFSPSGSDYEHMNDTRINVLSHEHPCSLLTHTTYREKDHSEPQLSSKNMIS